MLTHRQNVPIWRSFALILVLSIFLASFANLFALPGTARAAVTEWPSYLHDAQHSGASDDPTFTTNSAAQLTKRWAYKTGAGIAAQSAVVGGVIYIGSWDGYEYALDAATGALKWKTNLGQTIAPKCVPATIGVTSSATVQDGVVYVGGGDRYWYALDSATGNVLWKVDTGDNSVTSGHYNWSSPLIAGGYAYVGVASNCDLPLVQGLLLKIDLTSHQIVSTFKAANDGEVGAGIWTSPALDTDANTIYVTTGTISLTTQQYAQAMVAIDPVTMTAKDSWQIPSDQAGIDLDWGTSPTLFTDANGHKLVSATNKDGIFYAFDRANLHQGPVWQVSAALTGDCPPCGNGSVSSGAYGAGRLYMAGGNTTINGQGYPGAVRAIDPATGKILWEQGVPNPVIPALTYSNGLLIDEAGPIFEVRDAATGKRLYTYQTTGFYGAASVANGFIYAGALDGTVYAFGLPTAPPVVPPVDPNCPPGWTCQDVNTSPAGSEAATGATWNITAGGTGIAGAADSYRFLSQNVADTTQISATVTALPATAGVSQTGLMLRQNNDPTSPYYAILLASDNSLVVQYRGAFGGNPTVAKKLNKVQKPLSLLIQRMGDRIQAATSTDGTTYTLVPGSTVTQVFPSTVMVGVAVSAGVNGASGNATVSNVTLSAPGAVNLPQLPSPCPTGWTCGDVGNPQLVGDQALANGTWTLKGAGTDIANYADQFHYAWQTLTGDGTVSTHVTAQDNTSPGAKAGVLFRQSTNPGSPYYGVFVTPGKGSLVQYRDVLGLNTVPVTHMNGKAPVYLQVARWRNSFTAYTSTDGTNWTPIPDSTVLLDFPTTMQAGLVVSAGNAGTLANVAMDNVSVATTAPVPPVLCPDGWSCADIANSVPTGSESLNNGTWTIRAGGSDIWGLYDQFHFDWQTLAADGSISAHITSLDNTDSWAKAGVMLRQSGSAEAPYYAAFVTAGNGITIQYRLATRGESAQIIVPNSTSSLPVYLKVARAGGIFTAYTSTDGQNWTAVAGSSLRLTLAGPLLAGLATTAHTTADRTTATYDAVTLLNTATPPPNACPGPWSCSDIGDPLLVGSQALNNGTWTIGGSGSDIWGNADQFHYVWQTLNGDGTVSAHVTAQDNTDPWARAGVMQRQSTDVGSPYYAAFVSHDNGIVVQYRPTLGATTVQLLFPGMAPAYLQVARSGTTFTAYTSTDGTNWTPLANSGVRIAALTGSIYAGLAVTSHNVAAVNNATLDTVSVATTAPQPPVPACPDPWNCADVGNPSIIGNQTLNNGTWTVQGGGSDIWNTADVFHYIWQTSAADTTVSAHVTAQNNTDPWAKAGVMLRTSTDAGSPYYAAFVTPGNGITVQYRSTQGGTTNAVTVAGGVPAYLQVARSGATFTAYTSTDGTNWTPIAGSTIRLGLTGTLLAGIAVTSHNDSYLGVVTLDNVAIATTAPPPPAPACPDSWNCADIGTPALPGSQTLANGVWTIKGGGADIYGTSDSFHYTWQTLNADGGISAHITAQDNTDPWAKAGVMLRQSTNAASPYYAVFATPGNGITVHYRAAQGEATTTLTIPGTVPTYLKVARTGTNYTAYSSQNGTTWTEIAGSAVTLNLTTPTLAGLVVSSHNDSILCSATFDTVTIG